MTSYQGGKQRLGKEIYEIISSLEEYLLDNISLPYFEPFCGMCGVMKHFAQNNSSNRKLTACDYNKDIILLWQALQKGWKPPAKCSKEVYFKLKYSTHNSAKRGFVGTVCSFGGIFFGGYRPVKSYDRPEYNYVKNSGENLIETAALMKQVKFLNSQSYDKFNPKGYLIYCDPPYIGNTFQNVTEYFKFDHDKFWNMMRKWSKNNIVVISEYQAPNDFVCVWSKKFSYGFNKDGKGHKDCVEKLFAHSSYFE